MIIGYVRVSTRDQVHNLQVDAMSAAGVDRIFIETASGAQKDRPELAHAIEYCRSGDTLVVWRLDRLARSMAQLIETVTGLEAKGIGFKSLTEAIDTGTANGRLVFHLFGSIAAFERDLIRERSRAGIAAARARGRVGGRPRGMKDGDIAAARALLADPAITVAEAARRLGVGAATLYRYLPPGGRSAL